MFLYGLKNQRHRRIWIKLTSIMLLAGLVLISSAAAWGSPSGITGQVTSIALERSGSVSSPEPFGRFLVVAEALYEAVNRGKLEEASARLADAERGFRSLPMINITTAEGIQALAQNITELKRAAAAASPDEDRWKQGAAALRLSADALSHPNKPIWHQYRTIIQEDVIRIRTILEQKDTESDVAVKAALAEFNQMSQHYHVIRTAVLLHSEPWIVERSDSVMRYASRVLSAVPSNPYLLPSVVSQLKEAMEGLFPPNKTAESAIVPPITAPPWGWTAMMGSFIVTVLTWVGWRRYKADPYTPSGKSSKANRPVDAAERLLKHWNK